MIQGINGYVETKEESALGKVARITDVKNVASEGKPERFAPQEVGGEAPQEELPHSSSSNQEPTPDFIGEAIANRGSGGSGGSGGNVRVIQTDEVVITADIDYYDRMRLWFKKTFGYKIKPGRDIFDKMRDNAKTIRMVALLAFGTTGAVLIAKKKIELGIVAIALGISAFAIFPNTKKNER